MNRDESKPHILVVEDARDIREPLGRYLRENGYRATTAPDASAARKVLKASGIDLVVLDIMMPGEDGLSLCRSIRETSQTPVILLTARGEAVDRILGLEIGADDYLAKPFDPRELVARIRAVLRRTREAAAGAAHTEHDHDEVLQVGGIQLSLGSRTVNCAGKPVDLTSVEFNVLELLLRNAGTVVTREQIAEVALGRPLNTFDRSVDVHVSRLRKKLGSLPGADDLIRPIRGIGYFLSAGTPEKSSA